MANLIQPYQGGTILNPFGPNGGAQGTRVNFQFWQQPVFQQTDGTYYCPGFEGPTFATSVWDYVKIAVTYGPNVGGSPPDRTPGICKVRVRKEYAVDKKKPAGSNGARVTIHGVDVADVDIEIRIWTPEQLRQLALMWADLFPPANKGTPIAFDVQHPVLSQHGIKSIQCVSGDGPDVQQDRTAIFRIKALEFSKPSTTNATKTTASALGTIYDAAIASYPTPGQTASNLKP